MSHKLSVGDLGSSYAGGYEPPSMDTSSNLLDLDMPAGLSPGSSAAEQAAFNKEVDDFIPTSSGEDIMAQLSGEIGSSEASTNNSNPDWMNAGGGQTGAPPPLSGSIGGAPAASPRSNIEPMQMEGPETDEQGWAEKAQAVGSGLRKGAEEMKNSIISGQLPDVSVGALVPSVELHKMRGPMMFCGIGQPNGFNIPSCTELLPRVKTNLGVFSANYGALCVFIAVCTTITNMTFIFIVAALALAWNKVLKMNSADEVQQFGPLAITKMHRMIGMYVVTAFLLYYFGESVVGKILSYSIFFILFHAVFRNYQPTTEGGTQHTALPTTNPDAAPASGGFGGMGAGAGAPNLMQTMQQGMAVAQMANTMGAMAQQMGINTQPQAGAVHPSMNAV